MDASLCIIFNFLGFISSAITAYVYEFVHRAESIEEKCIVHITASLAMTEFLIFINSAFGYYSLFSLMQDAAKVITTFALSSFLWSLILAFHIKKKFTPKLDETSKDSKSISNDSEFMKKYLLIGYGIPFLVFSCYLGGVKRDVTDAIMQSTILADVVITVVNGLIFISVSTDLLRRIDNAKASLKSNDPVKVDVQKLEYQQRFMNTLFRILVLPWLILLAVLIAASTIARHSVMSAFVLLGPLIVIGLQGILFGANLVLRRKKIWLDIEREYGWKKPAELRTLDKILGYTSEDDDEEDVTSRKTRWDLLANVCHLMEKIKSTKKEANQQPNHKVNSEKEIQNIQPAIHQYVGQAVLPAYTDHTDATKKLINEMV